VQAKPFVLGMDLSKEGNVFGLNENLQPTMNDMENRLTDEAIHAGVRDTGGRVTLAIFDCKKPVIAAINGAAVGIGATMTLAMDIRLASKKHVLVLYLAKLALHLKPVPAGFYRVLWVLAKP
jgi:enoyl-CoA hydratase/carnithine racemase